MSVCAASLEILSGKKKPRVYEAGHACVCMSLHRYTRVCADVRAGGIRVSCPSIRTRKRYAGCKHTPWATALLSRQTPRKRKSSLYLSLFRETLGVLLRVLLQEQTSSRKTETPACFKVLQTCRYLLGRRLLLYMQACRTRAEGNPYVPTEVRSLQVPSYTHRPFLVYCLKLPESKLLPYTASLPHDVCLSARALTDGLSPEY